MTITQDQEKELQKAAKESCFQQRVIGGNEYYDGFIAGAKHQDAISRRDERERVITLFQDKLDLLDIYSFGKREWEIVRNVFKQVVEETTK